MCVVGDGPYLVRRVQGAQLARLGDVDDERLGPVFVIPPPGFLGDEIGRELAVGRRNREKLDTAAFSGAPPSSAWMWAVFAQITAPQRGNIESSPTTLAPVPLNTGKACTPSPKCCATHLLQSGCVDVLAVGDLVSVVGVGDRREHLGVHTRIVVGGEATDRGVVKWAHD